MARMRLNLVGFEAHVEATDMVRKGTDRDEIDTALSIVAESIHSYAARRLGLVLAVDQLDSLTSLCGCEIVEHDAIDTTDCENLIQLIEVAHLDLNAKILAFLLEILVDAGDGLIDAAREVNVVILEENHVEETDTVIAAAADLDCHLVEKAHARGRLASVDNLGMETLELGDVTRGGCGDAAHVLHDVEDEPLGEEERLGASLDTESDIALLDAVAVMENLVELEIGIYVRKNLTSNVYAREDTVLLDDELGTSDSVSWDARERGVVTITDILADATVDEVVEVSVEICHFCSSILSCFICCEPAAG